MNSSFYWDCNSRASFEIQKGYMYIQLLWKVI